MLKKYNEFINEFIKENISSPITDENIQYLIDVCKQATLDQYSTQFYLKEPLEIGMTNGHILYLSYIDIDDQQNISWWVIFNETPDKLTGNKWDSGVLYNEDGQLVFTENNNKYQLNEDFIEKTVETIKSYSDLPEWCSKLRNMKELNRKWQRISNSDHKATWNEQVENTKNRIFHDSLLYRHNKPYGQQTLNDMLNMGEEKFIANRKKNK